MNRNNKNILPRDFSNIPLSSSLAHLAYGDLAFKAWRKRKSEEIDKTSNNEE